MVINEVDSLVKDLIEKQSFEEEEEKFKYFYIFSNVKQSIDCFNEDNIDDNAFAERLVEQL